MTNRHQFLCGTIVFLFAEAVLILFVDRPLSDYLHTLSNESPALIDVFRAYTDLGKSVWYIWPSAISIAICAVMVRQTSLPLNWRQRIQRFGQGLIFVLAGVVCSGLLTDGIKIILGRARPVLLARDKFYGFHPLSFSSSWQSMPSGHATTAFALGFALIILLPRWRVLFGICACILAVSRVMVNAHYLSDIFAGGIVAYLTITVLWYVLTHNGKYLFEKVFFPLTHVKSKYRTTT
jgi:membrane-associated phospholipid phosphatase